MFKNAQKHFKEVDPIIYSASIKIEPFILKSSSDYFYYLCRSIISQQLSNKASESIFNRFIKLFPKEIPEPEYLLTLQDEKVRMCGISMPKIKYIRDLALKITKKEINLEELKDQDNEIIIKELTKVKGIGRWTSEMFLIFCLGREDVFSPGDLGLRNAIQKLYKLDKNISEDILEKITTKWSPYRTYASIILWRSLKI